MLIRFGGLLTLIAVGVWLWAVFDSITAPADRIRALPKAIWVIIVLLFSTLGAIAWFAFGRPRATARTPGGGVGRMLGGSSAGPPPRRSVAPDDDPDFLRRLRDEMRKPGTDQPPEEPRG
ncbi:MAG: PLD nuclease N-terminal domain-containing protein [Actinomycetota bacterium]